MMGVVRLVFTIVGCLLMTKWGRRSLTFISSIGCGATILMLGTYIFLNEQWRSNNEELVATWFPVLVIFTFTAASTVGYLIVPWVMIGELYPIKVRGLVGGFTTSLCHIFIFFAVKTYPILKRWFNPYGPFWIYGAISLLGTIFLYLYLPETKGKSLEEIQDYFSSGNSNAKKETLLTKKPLKYDKPIVKNANKTNLNGNAIVVV